MYCNKCGKEIVDGSKFCSFCGAPLEIPAQTVPEEPVSMFAEETAPVSIEPAFQEPVIEEPAAPSKPFIDDINWNVTEYPNADAPKKTEDINFDWGADPKDIQDRYTRGLSLQEKAQVNATADLMAEDIFPKAALEPETVKPAFAEPAKPAFAEPVFPFEPDVQPEPEMLSASDKIDKFYTFSKKNEEFQQLLNREYDKIRTGGAIGQEQRVADEAAAQKFEERPQDPSMEAFLEREGVNKPYEPKAFESDVLARIEAQERAKEEARLEEEARQKALEEARIKAAEEAKARIEEEERRQAEEEARRQAEEQARIAAEEAERARRAEEERLAEEARIRAEEEARIAEGKL